MTDETTLIRINKTTKERLDKLKLHKRQSYDEILDDILNWLLSLESKEPNQEESKLEEIKSKEPMTPITI